MMVRGTCAATLFHSVSVRIYVLCFTQTDIVSCSLASSFNDEHMISSHRDPPCASRYHLFSSQWWKEYKHNELSKTLKRYYSQSQRTDQDKCLTHYPERSL